MPRPDNVWNIAHRGASAHAPENTLAAFRVAVEMGADFIETDLRMTADSQIVAMHDPTLESTTNGRGKVAKRTLAELKSVDAGEWFVANAVRPFRGERVPALDEILRFSREARIPLYLEIKGRKALQIARSLSEVLRGPGGVQQTNVISFDSTVLRLLARINPCVATGLLVERPGRGSVRRALTAGARQLLPQFRRITPKILQAAREEGLKVIAWTVDEIEDMRKLIEMGVDGIITDYPERLANLLST